MSVSYSLGLNFSSPSTGDTDYFATADARDQKISAHDHSGGGKGLQLTSTAFADGSIDGNKILLANNQTLKGRNQANSANIDVLRVDTNNLVELPTVTRLTNTQTITTSATFSISGNQVVFNSAGALTVTFNVPTAAQAGQPVFVVNQGAGTVTLTITGRPAATDVATIVQYGSLTLIPISTTTWAAIPGGGTTLA